MDALCDDDVAARIGRAELLHAVCYKPHKCRKISLDWGLVAEEGTPQLVPSGQGVFWSRSFGVAHEVIFHIDVCKAAFLGQIDTNGALAATGTDILPHESDAFGLVLCPPRGSVVGRGLGSGCLVLIKKYGILFLQ